MSIHNVHKLTHLQVRYNVFVQFYNICTHCFIPSNLNKLLYIPRYVNGILLKTNKFIILQSLQIKEILTRIYIFISTFYTIFITQALSTQSLLVC